MIELIPKISLSDSKTWVYPTKTICFSIQDIIRGFRYLNQEYFKDKRILISGILPDELDILYSEFLDHYPSLTSNNYLLTTADCATYESMNEQERNKEIQGMLDENTDLFMRYPNQKFIGILAGVTSEEYAWTYNELKPYCKEFLIYLTGYIRSNPRYFDLLQLLQKILPNGIKEPIWCYGFNNASVKYLPGILKKWNLGFAITESYRMEAVFRGGHHYSRKVKMQKAWEKKIKLFRNN